MAKETKKIKKKEKRTISLWDFYWQVSLAAQRLTLIHEVLKLNRGEIKDEFDWIMESFDGENIEVDENGEFEITTGYVTVRGWIDSDTKEQKVDFYFDLASN